MHILIWLMKVSQHSLFILFAGIEPMQSLVQFKRLKCLIQGWLVESSNISLKTAYNLFVKPYNKPSWSSWIWNSYMPPSQFSYSIQMVKWINSRQTWFDSWKCLNTQFLFCLLESSQCKAWSDSKGLKDSIQGWLDMIHMMILIDSNWIWSIHFSIIWIDLWTILID